MQKLILVIFSISISFANANFLTDNTGRFGKLNFNNKNYCFKVSETSIKPIKNLGNCENVDGLYATKQGSVCLETSEITCNKTSLKDGLYSWGEDGTIKIYSSIGGLQSDTPISKLKTNKVESSSSSDDDNELSGKKLYGKAKKFFEKKEYYKAYEYAKKSADKGYKGGFYGLGLAYEKGYGVVDIDKEKAIEYYQKASDLGHMRAKTRLKKLSGKSSLSSSSNTIKDTKYSCNGAMWDFGATGSSNSQESYWEYPEVKNGVMSVPKFGTFTLRGKKNRKIYWKRTSGVDEKHNWAKIDLSGGESLITKKDGFSIFQFKGKCSIKN